MQYIMDEARSNGIVVPFLSNDPGPYGHNAPESGVGAVDVYGHDYYPWVKHWTASERITHLGRQQGGQTRCQQMALKNVNKRSWASRENGCVMHCQVLARRLYMPCMLLDWTYKE